MKSHTIPGGGGTGLHVVESGNPDGPPIVFIHGVFQSWLAWSRQMRSDLANTCRLVAMDLRGHGLSDKPREGYTDSRLWAEDVHAVIQGLHLDRPVLCGWSYGPLVVLDYVRHYGTTGLRGLSFVGGVTKLGSDDAASVLTSDFLSLLPAFSSPDALESTHALDALVRLLFEHELSSEEHYMMLGYNVSAPPYVRQALFDRSLDNDDLLPEIGRPVLITHGADDAVVKPAVIEEQMASIRQSRIHVMENAGHACFWDDAGAYNRHLKEFVESL